MSPSAAPRRDGATRVAVVGGGWAGLAAAVEATRRGDHVTLFEMAPRLGGRARDVATNVAAGVAGVADAIDAADAADAAHGGERAAVPLDNGQHILIGAYVETLALLRTLGVDPAAAFLRTPLRVTYPDGVGLQLQPGAPMPAFAAAVLRERGWPLAARLALLRAATGWALRGFRCHPALTVAELTRRLPAAVRDDLIDPLCVAALNTPATDASASVFLRVLKDALFSGPGSADLLLPRVGLSALVPEPAQRWLTGSGASVRLAHRVDTLKPDERGWSVDGERFDRVVLATTPTEAARLVRVVAPDWSARAAALRYEPIVTVYLRADGVSLPEPMLALRSSVDAPAQFVFDRGQLGGPPGLLAFVVSGAQEWVDRGMTATTEAMLRQARSALRDRIGGAALAPVRTLTEKRATFRCTPGLSRPAMRIAPGLVAAGDHVDGPYPATLEGAVRSGMAAARVDG